MSHYVSILTLELIAMDSSACHKAESVKDGLLKQCWSFWQVLKFTQSI